MESPVEGMTKAVSVSLDGNNASFVYSVSPWAAVRKQECFGGILTACKDNSSVEQQ